jgi:hypothetical protein
LKGGWRPAAAGKTGAQRGDSPPAPAAAATLPEECRRAGKQREQRREASPSVSWPSQSTPSSQEQPPVHSARRPSPAPSPPASVPAPTAATASPVGAPASPAVTPARRQQQATLQRPGRGPPPPSLLRRFQCSVVGRHFQKHEVDCRSGQVRRCRASPGAHPPPLAPAASSAGRCCRCACCPALACSACCRVCWRGAPVVCAEAGCGV